MSAVYYPMGDDRIADYIRLEEARELVEAVRSDLPRNGAAYDRADSAVHNISELMRGLR